MVTPSLLTTPPISIVSGTAGPLGIPGGIWKTTSLIATEDTDAPENAMFSSGTCTPPTRMIGFVTVLRKTMFEAVQTPSGSQELWPSSMGGLTPPRPLHHIVRKSPSFAGRLG